MSKKKFLKPVAVLVASLGASLSHSFLPNEEAQTLTNNDTTQSPVVENTEVTSDTDFIISPSESMVQMAAHSSHASHASHSSHSSHYSSSY